MNDKTKSPSPIQRNFCDISEEINSHIEYAQIQKQMGIAGKLNWQKLLESRRILIVSEAGSGKTYECKQIQQQLWENGQPAFFLELAELAKIGVYDQLSSCEIERFEAWQSSHTDIATFFLDSIDELKLTQGNFTVALTRLERKLSKNLHRARIVITTRPIPFDGDEIKRILPVPQSNEEANLGEISLEESFARIAAGHISSNGQEKKAPEVPNWRHVYLMPLSTEHIHQIAHAQKIENIDELLNAIHQRDLEDFTHRPLDLIELCIDWREHKRIRTHQEQLENNIRVKLKPRVDRGELTPLSPEKALDGASKLALACLLSKKLTIRHSAESEQVANTESTLDPSSILIDWNEKERKTLLERALFGFANYGRIRFHHRSVIEFLAAKQLNNLLRAGMTMKALKRLLFAETPQGIKIIKPSLRPIIAWLAANDDSIFKEVLEREPEVLLNFGDPESLSFSQRCQALKTYVNRYKDGKWRGLHVPRLQVHRIASRELAPLILELWKLNIENHEVRELIIEIIEIGKIKECANLALTIALNHSAEWQERQSSITALIQFNDSGILDVLNDMLRHPEQWPERHIKSAIVDCFPLQLSIEQVGFLLQHVSEPPNEIGDLKWRWPKVIAESNLTQHALEQLRQKLNDLVLENAIPTRTELIDKTPRADLLNALAAVCLRLLTKNCFDDAVFNSSIVAQHFSEDHYSSQKEPISELGKALSSIPEQCRETFYFAHLAFIQSFHSAENRNYQFYHLSRQSPIQYNIQQDDIWIRKNLASKSLHTDTRAHLLKLMINIHSNAQHNSSEYFHNFISLVTDNEDLTKQLEEYSKPPKVYAEQIRWENQAKKYDEKNRRGDAKNRASWTALHREIWNAPHNVFSNERMWNTSWNLWHAALNDNSPKSAAWNRLFFEKYFGEEITNQFKHVLMNVWRSEKPVLRVERRDEDKNTWCESWNLGLWAISAESEDPDWATNLSHEEALLAARYVAIALNEFPAWLTNLISTHPLAVETVLGSELAGELNEITQSISYFKILQQLQRESPSFVKLFIPVLLQNFNSVSQLKETDDEKSASERLHLVVNLMLKYGNETVVDFVLSNAKEKLNKGLNTPFSFVWISTLLAISPTDAATILENELVVDESNEVSSGVKWIAKLFGKELNERLFTLANTNFTPRVLLKLLRLAYKHAPPKNDPLHKGSFTPNMRDNAKRGRGALLNAILNLTGSEGWNAKHELAGDPLLADFKDRALSLAIESAAGEMDDQIYSPAEISTFYKSYEVSPKTRDELFKIMLDHLDDLEDSLMQDDSLKELWRTISEEKIMRQAISHELIRISRNNYHVSQEGVTAEEKETDIRIQLCNCDLQGVIELKLGDGRSGRDLRDTLKDQIVTKYMKPEYRRAGCLLVTVNSDKRWSHPDTGISLDIDGLRDMLKDEAQKIVTEMGLSLKLATKVLDLRPRLPTEKLREKK
ncbi:ATP-binding protein [Undibacterium seohonense]|uniref:ATP-binding protein n=1 Tax=Undibacterium seohonense TaxID=1344950 RepID=A0ABR6X7X6_9BURK|nr:ATP-binding protein [Undibacterium seohonense]MBC3808920.1 ATP-binding protein [Undibacterium seohonense]